METEAKINGPLESQNRRIIWALLIALAFNVKHLMNTFFLIPSAMGRWVSLNAMVHFECVVFNPNPLKKVYV